MSSTAAVTGVQALAVDGLAQLVGPIANFTTIMILGGFLTFYLLEDGDRAGTRRRAASATGMREAMTARGTIALEQVSGYLRGTSVMATTDGLFAAAILFVLGVPFAGPLGVIVFIGGFVPYLGSLATTTILALVTFAAEGFGGVALLLVLLGLSNIAQQRWLVPRVFGLGQRVNPGLALISIAIGGAIFGALGIFAAVPVLAAVRRSPRRRSGPARDRARASRRDTSSSPSGSTGSPRSAGGRSSSSPCSPSSRGRSSCRSSACR